MVTMAGVGKERSWQARQDSEKLYRRLFESAKDGILILDADTGKVFDVNPFLLQLLGYTELELNKVDPAQPLHADLEQIHMAATRSTDITRQLLAFARKLKTSIRKNAV